MGLFDSFRAGLLRSWCASLPPETVAGAIVDGVTNRPDAVQLIDALMVRLANRNPVPIGMFGRNMVDTLPGSDPHQRRFYEVVPYARSTIGAGCVVIAQDAAGEDYILLGKRSDGTGWGLPCGYMNVAPSFNAQGIFSDDIDHKRDRYEERLVKEGKRIADEPVNRLIDQRPDYDKSPIDTAIRETREEVGLDLRPEQLEFVSSEPFDGSNNAQPRQNQCYYYLVDLRGQKTLPPVAATDDLLEPRFVKLSDLKSENGVLQLEGAPIVENVAVEKAISQMRRNEYAHFGVTAEAIANFSHLPKPERVISPEAAAWHKNALSVAESMKKTLDKMQRDNKPAIDYGLSA